MRTTRIASVIGHPMAPLASFPRVVAAMTAMPRAISHPRATISMGPPISSLQRANHHLRPYSTPSSTPSSKSKTTTPSPSPTNGIPPEIEVPKADFSQLGLGKGMKVTLLVIVSIFGTIETIFYCKAIWRWWKSREEGVVA